MLFVYESGLLYSALAAGLIFLRPNHFLLDLFKLI